MLPTLGICLLPKAFPLGLLFPFLKLLNPGLFWLYLAVVRLDHPWLSHHFCFLGSEGLVPLLFPFLELLGLRATVVLAVSQSTIASQFSMKVSRVSGLDAKGSNPIQSISRCHFLEVVKSRISIKSLLLNDWVIPKGGSNVSS
jgi:hypothetical protein